MVVVVVVICGSCSSVPGGGRVRRLVGNVDCADSEGAANRGGSGFGFDS